MTDTPGVTPYDRLISLAQTDLKAAVGEALHLRLSPSDARVSCSAAGALVDLGFQHEEVLLSAAGRAHKAASMLGGGQRHHVTQYVGQS